MRFRFEMGDNIVGTFTEIGKYPYNYTFDIQGSGYMYDKAEKFNAIDNANNYKLFLAFCKQKIVSVPSGIRSIAAECFIDIGSSAIKNTGIGDVEQINIGEDVEYIGEEAFSSENYVSGGGIKSVVLLGDNPKLREVNKRCFYMQKTLEKIEFRGYVNLVANKAFYGCSNLQEIGLADDYKYSNYNGGDVFHGCSKLTRISKSNTVVNINKGHGNYIGCNSLQYITIRDKIDSLNDIYSSYKKCSDLYVEPFKGVECDSDGDLITYLNTPFSWYFNDNIIKWKKNINRHIVNIVNDKVYVYHNGKIIELNCYISGDVPMSHKGKWEWLNVVRQSQNEKFSPVHFTHDERWYQFKY